MSRRQELERGADLSRKLKSEIEHLQIQREKHKRESSRSQLENVVAEVRIGEKIVPLKASEEKGLRNIVGGKEQSIESPLNEEEGAQWIQRATKRFRDKWKLEQLFNEQNVLLPTDTSTLRLIYGKPSPAKSESQVHNTQWQRQFDLESEKARFKERQRELEQEAIQYIHQRNKYARNMAYSGGLGSLNTSSAGSLYRSSHGNSIMKELNKSRQPENIRTYKQTGMEVNYIDEKEMNNLRNKQIKEHVADQMESHKRFEDYLFQKHQLKSKYAHDRLHLGDASKHHMETEREDLVPGRGKTGAILRRAPELNVLAKSDPDHTLEDYQSFGDPPGNMNIFLSPFQRNLREKHGIRVAGEIGSPPLSVGVSNSRELWGDEKQSMYSIYNTRGMNPMNESNQMPLLNSFRKSRYELDPLTISQEEGEGEGEKVKTDFEREWEEGEHPERSEHPERPSALEQLQRLDLHPTRGGDQGLNLGGRPFMFKTYQGGDLDNENNNADNIELLHTQESAHTPHRDKLRQLRHDLGMGEDIYGIKDSKPPVEKRRLYLEQQLSTLSNLTALGKEKKRLYLEERLSPAPYLTYRPQVKEGSIGIANPKMNTFLSGYSPNMPRSRSAMKGELGYIMSEKELHNLRSRLLPPKEEESLPIVQIAIPEKRGRAHSDAMESPSKYSSTPGGKRMVRSLSSDKLCVVDEPKEGNFPKAPRRQDIQNYSRLWPAPKNIGGGISPERMSELQREMKELVEDAREKLRLQRLGNSGRKGEGVEREEGSEWGEIFHTMNLTKDKLDSMIIANGGELLSKSHIPPSNLPSKVSAHSRLSMREFFRILMHLQYTYTKKYFFSKLRAYTGGDKETAERDLLRGLRLQEIYTYIQKKSTFPYFRRWYFTSLRNRSTPKLSERILHKNKLLSKIVSKVCKDNDIKVIEYFWKWRTICSPIFWKGRGSELESERRPIVHVSSDELYKRGRHKRKSSAKSQGAINTDNRRERKKSSKSAMSREETIQEYSSFANQFSPVGSKFSEPKLQTQGGAYTMGDQDNIENLKNTENIDNVDNTENEDNEDNIDNTENEDNAENVDEPMPEGSEMGEEEFMEVWTGHQSEIQGDQGVVHHSPLQSEGEGYSTEYGLHKHRGRLLLKPRNLEVIGKWKHKMETHNNTPPTYYESEGMLGLGVGGDYRDPGEYQGEEGVVSIPNAPHRQLKKKKEGFRKPKYEEVAEVMRLSAIWEENEGEGDVIIPDKQTYREEISCKDPWVKGQLGLRPITAHEEEPKWIPHYALPQVIMREEEFVEILKGEEWERVEGEEGYISGQTAQSEEKHCKDPWFQYDHVLTSQEHKFRATLTLSKYIRRRLTNEFHLFKSMTMLSQQRQIIYKAKTICNLWIRKNKKMKNLVIQRWVEVAKLLRVYSKENYRKNLLTSLIKKDIRNKKQVIQITIKKWKRTIHRIKRGEEELKGNFSALSIQRGVTRMSKWLVKVSCKELFETWRIHQNRLLVMKYANKKGLKFLSRGERLKVTMNN